MARLTFMDSGAIYALADRNDTDHKIAATVYHDRSRSFITHPLILTELFSLLTKRLHKGAAISVVEALQRSPRVEIVALTPSLLEAGWLRCLKFEDKDWNWIDCCSFEVMKQRGVRDAFSLDRHYKQAGFKLLLR